MTEESHSRDVGSSSTKVSVVDEEKADSPLVSCSWPVGLRYCSLIPNTFAKPWPTLLAALDDMLISQQRSMDNATKIDERTFRLAIYTPRPKILLGLVASPFWGEGGGE